MAAASGVTNNNSLHQIGNDHCIIPDDELIDDGPSSRYPIEYPGNGDIVRFWPWGFSQRSCGNNVLRITRCTQPGVNSFKKAFKVDFNGSAYGKDEQENRLSELKWQIVGHKSDIGIQVILRMHDPNKPNYYEFPYVLCIYDIKGKPTPCAVYIGKTEEGAPSTLIPASAYFNILHVAWGSSWLYSISDLYIPENIIPASSPSRRHDMTDQNGISDETSPWYVVPSPDGDAIRVRSVRQPFQLNPMTLMFLSDQGIREKPVKTNRHKSRLPKSTSRIHWH